MIPFGRKALKNRQNITMAQLDSAMWTVHEVEGYQWQSLVQ